MPSPHDLDAGSRRTFLKRGAAVSGGLALGLPDAAGAAQDDADDDGESGGGDARNGVMFVDQFKPGANFVIVSPAVDWTPDVPEIRTLDPFNYNSRVIRYLNVNEFRILFVSQNAALPTYDTNVGYVVDDDEAYAPGETPQPEVYRLHEESNVVGDTEGLVRLVTFSPLGEATEADALETEDWWPVEPGA